MFTHSHERNQLKPTRDDRRSKEIHELKSENKRLKREVARLTKKANRNTHRVEELEEVHSELGLEETSGTIATVPIGPSCEECKSIDVVHFNTPSGVQLSICKTCGHKSKNKPG